jgi:hypothetical protein
VERGAAAALRKGMRPHADAHLKAQLRERSEHFAKRLMVRFPQFGAQNLLSVTVAFRVAAKIRCAACAGARAFTFSPL